MKKIFFVAIAATLLAAGCQKTEVLNQVNPVDGTSMTFAPNMGKLTKAATADGEGETNLSEQNFRLWAYYKDDDPSRGAYANTIYDGMENILVHDDGSDGKWGTNVPHFWPGENKKLKFFAISADPDTYGSENSTTTTTGENTTATRVAVSATAGGGTMIVNNFIVSNLAPDVDLMIADYTEADQSINSGTEKAKAVNLQFRHALSKVQFLFKNDEAEDTDVYVQGMFVQSIKTKATLTATCTSASTELSWGEETSKTEPALFKGNYTAKPDVDGESLSIPSDKTAANIATFTDVMQIPSKGHMKLTDEYADYTTWLVIPQEVGTSNEFDKSLVVTIAYVIGDRQFVSKFPLYDTNVDKWACNQYIKYKINLTPNMIAFNPTVEPWTPTGADGDETDDTGKDVGINN